MKRFLAAAFLSSVLMVYPVICSAAGQDDTIPVEPVKVSKKATKKSAAAKQNLIDINTAGSEQLMTLPGITAEDSARIIAGRPYARKNQLKQKNILPAATYDGIKAKIVAKKVVQETQAPR